jgi:L-lactate dehydrogenase complex protein LldG
MDSRQQILDSIRKALEQPSHIPADPPVQELLQAIAAESQSLDEKMLRFSRELIAVAGEYVEVATESEVAEKITELLQDAAAESAAVSGGAVIQRLEAALAERGIRTIRPETLPEESRKNDVAQIPVGIVEAAFAVADSGTVAVPFGGCSTLPHFLPEIVVVLVSARSLVSDHFELFGKLSADERKNMMLVTGPSRTADIEKILILGAHGPRRLIVCMIKDGPGSTGAGLRG